MTVQLPNPMLTTAEVSTYLQIPVATIHQWRHRGEGPRASRVGRHLRFRLSDVDAWLAQQTDSRAGSAA